RPDEGREREVCTGAGGTQMGEGEHKEDQAYSDTEVAVHRSRSDEYGRRPCRAKAKSQRDVGRASNDPLEDGNPDGIGGGNLPGEVVVDAPTEAGGDDQQPADIQIDAMTGPRQNDRTGHD